MRDRFTATVTRSTVWSDNEVLTASALNGEFNNLLNAVALTNADIASGAAIAESKLLFSASGHGHTGGTDGKDIPAKFGFFIAGHPGDSTNVSWNPIVPRNQTVTTLYAYNQTRPTGSGITLRIFNLTQDIAVASITIAMNQFTATTSSMTNPSLSAGDVLSLDVTSTDGGGTSAFISLVLF